MKRRIRVQTEDMLIGDVAARPRLAFPPALNKHSDKEAWVLQEPHTKRTAPDIRYEL